MSEERTCGDIAKCICSQELGAGASRCEWQDGKTAGQSGPDPRPVSRSASPGGEPVQMTLGTYGLTCDDWLQSAVPKSCSGSKSARQSEWVGWMVCWTTSQTMGMRRPHPS